MSLSSDLNAIPRLFGDAVEQLGKLVQNEVQLARAELSQKITQASIGAAYIAGAAILFDPGAGGSAHRSRIVACRNLASRPPRPISLRQSAVRSSV